MEISTVQKSQFSQDEPPWGRGFHCPHTAMLYYEEGTGDVHMIVQTDTGSLGNPCLLQQQLHTRQDILQSLQSSCSVCKCRIITVHCLLGRWAQQRDMADIYTGWEPDI